MAKQKLTDLTQTSALNVNDLMYVVQSNTSKSANVNTLLSSIFTANVKETSSNLYFTNTRVRQAISVTGTGATYNANTGVINVTGVASSFVSNINGLTGNVTLSTSNITENLNLYYTNARVYSNVIGLLSTYVTQSSIPRGNLISKEYLINLVDDYFIINGVIKPELRLYRGRHYKFYNNTGIGLFLTDNSNQLLDHNVYYDDAIDFLGNISITITENTPSILKYKNEGLANSIGNIFVQTDNFVSLANTSNIALNVATIGNFNTDNLPESASNLYYTNARVRSAFVAGSNISISNGVISALVGGEPELSMINTFDFGTFENTLTSPLQYIFYSLGMDMGTFDSPAAFNIDLGNF